ncbi:MAG: hypothetical protein JSR62_04505 [Nitrospira sp.]|nr:hypothetical protein [Nitrospira sp.]
MAARRTLYLLRQPVTDMTRSLLPSADETGAVRTASLVLLEQAVESVPVFPGPIYMLASESEVSGHAGPQQVISYQELVTFITEHDTTIVL